MIYRPLLAVLSCMQLAGCGGSVSGLLAKIDPPQRTATNDVPEALPMNTERSRVLFLIIVAGLRDAGKSSAAAAYLRSYLKAYPNDPKAQLLLADSLADTHQEAAAGEIYAGLLESAQAAPSEAGLGHVAASRGDWAAASSHFTKALAKDNSNWSYLNDLGFAEIMTTRYGAAVDTLRQASELAPDNAMIRSNFIIALHLAGRDAEARAQISAIKSADERRRGAALLALSPAALHIAAPQTVASADIQPLREASR
jgi:Flp pilus assembly protein TadD